jgi:hypothetical protein
MYVLQEMYWIVGVIWSAVSGTRGKVACLRRSSVKYWEKPAVIIDIPVDGGWRLVSSKPGITGGPDPRELAPGLE